MEQVGKILLLVGLGLAAVGLVLWGLSAVGLRRLPGDFLWRLDGVTVIVPIGTCLALSVLLTLAMWLWQWWRG
jgi:multisubunit Na+/H+ antiporter MnhG subunit